MRFRSYDSLKIFDTVARSLSMTKAADEVHQSKGSISYQVGKLEADLGFRLFERAHATLELTEEGRRLWHVSQTALSQIDREIEDLRGTTSGAVTIGALTYFSSLAIAKAHPLLRGQSRYQPTDRTAQLR